MKSTIKKRKTVKKTAKRKVAKKTTPKKKPKKLQKSYLNAMEKKIYKALNQLKKDTKRKAPIQILKKSYNELLMLLGECNYIVREFHSHIKKRKRK